MVLCIGGCSFIFMERAPEPPIKKAPYCTGSKGFAAWDALLAIGALVTIGAVYSAYSDTDDSDSAETANTIMTLAALDGLAHAISGFWGNAEADACRRARDAWDEQDYEITIDSHTRRRKHKKARREPAADAGSADAGTDAGTDAGAADAGVSP